MPRRGRFTRSAITIPNEAYENQRIPRLPRIPHHGLRVACGLFILRILQMGMFGMRITQITVYRVELPLHEGSYKWSGGNSVDVFDSTIVEIKTDAGIPVPPHRKATARNPRRGRSSAQCPGTRNSHRLPMPRSAVHSHAASLAANSGTRCSPGPMRSSPCCAESPPGVLPLIHVALRAQLA